MEREADGVGIVPVRIEGVPRKEGFDPAEVPA
jgi:hypothetical protein